MGGDNDLLAIKDVRVGDLVFLQPDGDLLTQMITRYDHGAFSHVGIVVEPGVMASSRTSRLSLGPDDQDYGGIRLNAIADLSDRRPHIGRLSFTAEEGLDGVTRTLDLLEYGRAHRSGFSFVKLFLVGAALDAVQDDQTDPARTAILTSAARAAHAWEASEQRRLRQQQSFYCSEAICVAYPSMTFTYGDFCTFPAAPVTESALSPSDVLALVRHLCSELERYPTTGGQRDAVVDVVAALVTHDVGFLSEVARAAIEFLRPHVEADSVKQPGDGDPLPTSLVTPRVLTQSSWVEWVRPLVLPDLPRPGA